MGSISLARDHREQTTVKMKTGPVILLLVTLQFLASSAEDAPLVDRRTPARGYKMKVQVVVDASFKRKFGSKTQERIDKVIELASNYLQHSSLGTKFRLDQVGAYKQAPMDLTASSVALGVIGGLSYCYPQADHYVGLTGLVNTKTGKGYVGSACNDIAKLRHLRCSQSEYVKDDKTTAAIVVQQIGKALGMVYDYTSVNVGESYFYYLREDSKKNGCKGKGGYMDRPEHGAPRLWSSCSKEDWRKFFNRFGNFCFAKL